jgi:nucleoside-diphosphate-sugar epimerase
MDAAVVIFGASGFVGKHLMNHLIKYHPIGIDKSDWPKGNAYPTKRFVQSDVFSLDKIPLVDKPFYVINLMAELGSADEKINHRNNFDSVTKLYSVIRKTNQKCLGIIHFSSISAVREISHYGKTKKASENLVSSGNIPYVILQSEMIIGGGARSIEKLKKGLNLFPFFSFLPKGGEVIRYPIDIKDVCETSRLILINNFFNQKIYHLVSERKTMREISKVYTANTILPIPKFALLFVAKILELISSNPMFTYDNAVGVCSDTILKSEKINSNILNKKFNA